MLTTTQETDFLKPRTQTDTRVGGVVKPGNSAGREGMIYSIRNYDDATAMIMTGTVLGGHGYSPVCLLGSQLLQQLSLVG